MLKHVVSYILTIAGVLYAILSIATTIVIIPDALSQEAAADLTPFFLFIIMFFYFLPSFLLLFFGHRMRKKLKLKKLAVCQPVPQFNFMHNNMPFQQQTETRTFIKVEKAKPDPAPKKAIVVECKGCGAKKAVIKNEISSCDYCGSPLTADS